MPGEASYQWLGAEALAALFTTDVSFRKALVEVRQERGMLDGATRQVADELEAWTRPRARGESLDALRRHRDYVWFGTAAAQRRTLAEIVIAVAAKSLDHRGSKIMLKNASADEAGVWRSLSLALPADLFAAALCAESRTVPPTSMIDVSGPHIRRLLDRQPSCDTHMHVSAGYSFPLLWSSLMPRLADADADIYTIDGAGIPFGDRSVYVTRLLQAAIARLVMAGFLWCRESLDGALTLMQYVNGDKGARTSLGYVCRQLPWPAGTDDALELARRACGELATGHSPQTTVAELRRLYSVMLHAAPSGSDPLCVFFDARYADSIEATFAARAILYLRNSARDDRDDPPFAALFWQYQRVRCRTFRYITLEPGTAGLDWFTQHFSRLWRLREGIQPRLYRSALDLQSTGLHLGALEARAAPEPDAAAIEREVRNFAEQALQRPVDGEERPEIGVVFHFIKSAERDGRHVGDPSLGGWRYSGWHADARARAMAIAKALEHRPELLMVLRGADVANHELAVPLWTIVPVLQLVRNASVEAAERMRLRAPSWNCDPIGVTIHAGEDFRRLSEGLRRLHEPIEFGLLQPGDRIGHGVALGVDPASRAGVERCVVQPREERMFDLLWELERYARGHFAPDGSRLELVRDEVGRLGREIFAKQVPIDELRTLRRELHDPAILESYGYASATRPCGDECIVRYLTDAEVFVRAVAPIEVRTHPTEADMLRNAQKFLRRELGRLEITIESNPSSNLLIGDFISLEEHPAFRIQPLPRRRASDDGSVLLSVNTDNPITFATRLADEFAYLYYALIRSDVTADDALAWIDARREDGWRSRFTLAASKRRDVLRIVAEKSSFHAAEMLAAAATAANDGRN
jgi:hypothetical protein